MTTKTTGMLIIDGISLSVHALSPFSQTYERIGGSSTRRMLSGKGRKQTNWEKLATTITGGGLSPPGLAALDLDSPVDVSCAATRSIVSASSVIIIPSARRVDSGYEPFALAHVGVERIPTDVSMNVDEATITPVVGTDLYEIFYYPKFQAILSTVTENVQIDAKVFGWSLRAEEV